MVVEEVDTYYILVGEEAMDKRMNKSKSTPILRSESSPKQLESKEKRSKSCPNRNTKRASKQQESREPKTQRKLDPDFLNPTKRDRRVAIGSSSESQSDSENSQDGQLDELQKRRENRATRLNLFNSAGDD